MQNKSKAMREVIENLFSGTTRAIEEKICPMCRRPVDFDAMYKDDLMEYNISGLCKDCQDTVFK